MVSSWWELPSPRRFISRVTQDLKDGKNVILCLPEHLPDGLKNSVRNELGEDWDWHTLSLNSQEFVEPVHLLFEHFIGEISPDQFRNARTLAENPDFAGKIIWLDGLTPEVWVAWKRFLSDYEQPCRAIPQLDRTLFCVPLVGELAINPPAEDVCLSHRHWQGIVNRLDMLLFTSSLLQNKRLPDLQKRVVISVITNLALWDYHVSERLVDEKVENILSPLPILQEIANERNWDNNYDYSLADKWCRGIANTIEGEEKIHSAALAVNFSDKKEIERRIWSAEVGEILPFVEERRREILEQLAGILHIPFITVFGEQINDLWDLEIGHIEYQIRDIGTGVKNDMRQLIRQLREMRNALSHLQSISPELLLCREINDWYRILNPE